MAQHDPAKTPQTNRVPSAVTLEMHSNVSILEDMCSSWSTSGIHFTVQKKWG